MNAMNYFSVNKLFSKLTFQNFHLVLHLLVCVSNCAYFVFNCCFLTLVNKIQTGLVDQMAVMVLQQFYVTQWQSFFALISFFASVFSFIMISTGSWFPLWMILFALFISWVMRNNKINQSSNQNTRLWIRWPETHKFKVIFRMLKFYLHSSGQE